VGRGQRVRRAHARLVRSRRARARDRDDLEVDVVDRARRRDRPPTDEDVHPTEVHLSPDMDGVVRSFMFRMWFYDGDPPARRHARELAERDYHGAVDAREIDDALDVLVEARP
jgi:hypothetical protein